MDAAGRAIGETAKRGVRHASTPLHLAFSCYAVDSEGHLLVTQRARSKHVFPGAKPAPNPSEVGDVAWVSGAELGRQSRANSQHGREVVKS